MSVFVCLFVCLSVCLFVCLYVLCVLLGWFWGLLGFSCFCCFWGVGRGAGDNSASNAFKQLGKD